MRTATQTEGNTGVHLREEDLDMDFQTEVGQQGAITSRIHTVPVALAISVVEEAILLESASMSRDSNGRVHNTLWKPIWKVLQ